MVWIVDLFPLKGIDLALFLIGVEVISDAILAKGLEYAANHT